MRNHNSVHNGWPLLYVRVYVYNGVTGVYHEVMFDQYFFFFVALAAAGVEDCRPNLHVPLLSISHHNDTDDSARHA